MSVPRTPPYVSATLTPQYVVGLPAPQCVPPPPGLEVVPPPPLNYPVVTLPATPADSEFPAQVPPPTAPPTTPAPTLLGPIVQPPAEPPKVEACLEAPTVGSVADWPVDKVMEWLTETGLGHVSQNFEEHRITGDVLLELTSADLEEIGIRAFGDKKRLLRAVAQLKAPVTHAACPPPPPCWQATY